jgi:methionyl-tRNA synthetase
LPSSTFLSTTIPYVNAPPHIGHAFEYAQAAWYSRVLRSRQEDVFFLSGSDDNSLKNVLAAEAAGVSPQELVDDNVTYFLDLLAALDVDLSDFIRTSRSQDHRDGATALWTRMAERGDIYSKDYEGLYCVGCEQFYAESELIDGLCPEHLVRLDLVSERNYFFRLSRYADALTDLIEQGQLRIHPESRRNEVLGLIRSGLEDFSVSRSVGRARGWGIPVPGDPTQVMYVWVDALTNYINALGWSRDGEAFDRYWRNARSRIHFLGKGVLRFHAVYWPAMLLSAGLDLPTDVVVHGYLTAGGRKIGKSLGNGVDPMELIGRWGRDAVTYYLLAEMPAFGDADFVEANLVSRYNRDLANGLGNLVSRYLSMLHRYRDGRIPERYDLGPAEEALFARIRTARREADAAVDQFDHRGYLAQFAELTRHGNAYVDLMAPWHLAKAAAGGDEQAAADLDTALVVIGATIIQLATLVRVVVPDRAEQILDTLGGPHAAERAEDWLSGVPGRTVRQAGPIFPRLEGDLVAL